MPDRKNNLKELRSHPILTGTEAKRWEEGLLKDEAAEWAAMQRAGAAIARAIEEDFREIGGLPANARILVLMGKGHNGGDAVIAATHLLKSRPQARAVIDFCAREGSPRPLTMRAKREFVDTVGAQEELLIPGEEPDSSPFDLCLDGILGMQFRPPLDEFLSRKIAAINAHPNIRFRAAVDLPSGLGDESAQTVFRADFTYATGIVKAPVVAEASAASVGRLRYLDLGFFSESAPPSNAQVLTPQLLAPLAQLRPAQSDKRTFGHLFVLGGSHSYPGAVVMAVRGALHSGVGLVTAFVPEELVPEYAAQHPEAMWVGCPVNSAGGHSPAALTLLRSRLAQADAFLIGPGLGADAETLNLVAQLVAEVKVPFVLDADALRPEIIAAARGKPFIGTPHAGELQRIAPALDEASHGVIVRKGPLTSVVGRALCPTGAGDVGHKARPTVYYSPFGGPVLARGGSGDILAGLIGGLLAQKPDDPLLAACRGVVWHGLAADLLARTHGQVAVETTQLLEQLGPALNSHP
ncbi:MAG: nnr [Lacunisphaera sp.]|nr:nnr [Lacunisphaera sp.]